jgi:hypothetical protein
MYKFRKQYYEADISTELSDHSEYTRTFKRIINSEPNRLRNDRGEVILWAGLREDDAEETRADIMTFMESDPLISKDIVDKWDILALSAKEVEKLPVDDTVSQ